MPIHTHRKGWVYTTALSWRVMAHRFSFTLFLLFSFGILFVGHSQPRAIDGFRARVIDGIAPVMAVMSRPIELIDNVVARIQSYRSLVMENERLTIENQNLRRWQNKALVLTNENKELRALLHYKSEPSLAYISARVIADTGGAYVRSLVITAGRLDGVREGMAAVAGDGVIGRVVEVGEWTSRILLITDINSRIPVVLIGSGDKAILAGDNEAKPKLLYLPQDVDIKEGMRVMTSGHGGIFPPNLPVGVVTKVEQGQVEVAPIAMLTRVNQVRLVDFSLAGGVVNPATQQIQSTLPVF